MESSICHIPSTSFHLLFPTQVWATDTIHLDHYNGLSAALPTSSCVPLCFIFLLCNVFSNIIKLRSNNIQLKNTLDFKTNSKVRIINKTLILSYSMFQSLWNFFQFLEGVMFSLIYGPLNTVPSAWNSPSLLR